MFYVIDTGSIVTCRWGPEVVCVDSECLIGKQKKPILFKVTEPSSIPSNGETEFSVFNKLSNKFLKIEVISQKKLFGKQIPPAQPHVVTLMASTEAPRPRPAVPRIEPRISLAGLLSPRAKLVPISRPCPSQLEDSVCPSLHRALTMQRSERLTSVRH